MSSWGIIGIGRIGLSMARNMSSKDISLSLYDKTFDKKLNPIFETKKLYPELKSTLVFKDISSFVDSIQKPRKILVLVPYGKPNDQVISKLLEILDEGDILIDGGNTNPVISSNNHLKTKKNKILYLGMGVSGGTEGVLNGPSMMIGGDINAFNIVKKDFSLITSKTIDKSSSFDFFW